MRRKYYVALSILIISLFFLSCYKPSGRVSIESYFSPNIKNHLIYQLNRAKKTVDIAIYVFTDRDIAEILNKLADRGVRVRILFGETSDQFSSSVDEALTQKVRKRKDGIHRFESDGIMHDKFAIIDSSVLITGSYNWTYSANAKNNENIVIIKNYCDIVNKYERQFSYLWAKGKIIRVEMVKGEVNLNNIDEVKMCVGKYINGVGTVENVGYSKRSGTYFLNFGERGKGLTVVMFRKTASSYRNNRGSIFNLKGKTIRCYGKVRFYKRYGYEIILSNYKKLESIDD